ncbi:acyltransferase [Bacteroides graminisolvens]|uniref:acyltransferase n=1 Tax=Bacteroides graminisolvens TaxID=477666 RepID=UPI0023F2F8A1|nr:acyltransferase [Bacteroides graminisolvens]
MNFRILLMTYLSGIKRKCLMGFLHLKGYKNIDKSSIIEGTVVLDKVNPVGIHIGKNCLIAGGTSILSHEHIYRNPDNEFIPYMTDTYIGDRCFVGIRAIILPGVHIGDDCVIGAGCVVNKDIPSGSMAVGVPAKIIRTGIKMSDKATLLGEYK